MEQLRFDGRVAIVTGAGAGLGRAHALLLASRGAAVVVNDLGTGKDGTGADAGPAAAVVDEIRAAGGTAIADGNSVATTEGGAAIVARAIEEFGRLDIVVNNAGILRDKTLQGMTPEMFDAIVAVHLRGAFNVSQPAFVHMREAGYGRIVMTSSPAGLYGNFGQTNYSAVKMGLVGMARTISIEGERRGVVANVISPSAATRMTEGLMGDLADKLDPALVSPAVAWLCHETCPLKGEVLAVGGGRVARVFVGENVGYVNRALTIEDVVANQAIILDDSDVRHPVGVPGASALMMEAFDRYS